MTVIMPCRRCKHYRFTDDIVIFDKDDSLECKCGCHTNNEGGIAPLVDLGNGLIGL